MSACSCDARGEDIACPTHGAEATIRELQAAAGAEAEAGDVARREAARLRAENTRLREALEPFVYADGCEGAVPYCRRGEETCRWCAATAALGRDPGVPGSGG